MKICCRCKNNLSLNKFYKSKNSNDGFNSFCKKCDNARKTKYLREKAKANGSNRILTLQAKEWLEQGLKFCPRCKLLKSIKLFNKNKNNFSSHCKTCSRELGKMYYDVKKRHIYYLNRKRKLKDQTLKRKFGISIEEYDQILQKQNGVCAICGGKDKNKSLAVDHDHTSGKIRGLLCGRCNPGIS